MTCIYLVMRYIADKDGYHIPTVLEAYLSRKRAGKRAEDLMREWIDDSPSHGHPICGTWFRVKEVALMDKED